MKPIFLTQDTIDQIKKEFIDTLAKGMQDGTFTFTHSFASQTKEKAYIYYTQEAFLKTFALIQGYDSEVAWNCLARRLEEPNSYEIYDVIVYKQHVTGSTVTVDPAEMNEFFMSLTDEEADNLHAQCHSHVNMKTDASSTDLTHQHDILEAMGTNGFYIFQIWNKKFDCTSFIYDLDNNVYWENNDIICEIMDSNNGSLRSFVESTKKLVTKNNVVTYPQKFYGGSYYYGNVETGKKNTEPWYMSQDPKEKGEKDYDKEVFERYRPYYDEWDSGYIYS